MTEPTDRWQALQDIGYQLDHGGDVRGLEVAMRDVLDALDGIARAFAGAEDFEGRSVRYFAERVSEALRQTSRADVRLQHAPRCRHRIETTEPCTCAPNVIAMPQRSRPAAEAVPGHPLDADDCPF